MYAIITGYIRLRTAGSPLSIGSPRPNGPALARDWGQEDVPGPPRGSANVMPPLVLLPCPLKNLALQKRLEEETFDWGSPGMWTGSTYRRFTTRRTLLALHPLAGWLSHPLTSSQARSFRETSPISGSTHVSVAYGCIVTCLPE